MSRRAENGTVAAVSASSAAFENGAIAVESLDADGPRRDGVEAQLAQGALVDVGFDDRGLAVFAQCKDVDRAHLDELLGQRSVRRDLRSDFDFDEERHLSQ